MTGGIMSVVSSGPPASPVPAGVASAAGPAPAGKSGLTPPSRRGRSARLIGDVIADFGFASGERIEAAVATSRASGKPTGRVLLESGALTPDQLARVVAERFGLDHVDLTRYKVDMAAANLVGPAVAKRLGAVPIDHQGPRTLLVAMADPSNVLAVDDIGLMTGLEIVPAIASPDDIALLVGRLNRLEESVEDIVEEDRPAVAEVTDLRESAADAPIVKLVQSIIAQAVQQGASDIHFAATEQDMAVQFRIDGVLSHSLNVPRRMQAGVVSRIKIMSEMDIAERRAPQDGRLSLAVEDRTVDLRVVTLPLVSGESVVVRILDKNDSLIDLDHLGMLAAERQRFEQAFQQAFGAVLVTGPTGSGKSTSLYAALNAIGTGDRSILTIEDPVEYRMPGARQMQVNPKAGVTFATGLRSMLRADPDVVMVGEIRDRDTAQVAVEAALTGHLVLSTLHTNDAPTAITRLVEMGIEPFLVASAIDCVVAQRLARRLCRTCKKPVTLPAEVLRHSGFKVDEDIEVYEATGCGRCGNSGYKGRLGLYEVMTVSEKIRSLTLQRRPADDIAEVAEQEGMARLRDDGLAKVRRGETSVAEISRVTGTG